MKPDIHPQLHDVNVTCACGASYKTRSTLPEITVTLCSKCHPFFTGEQKFVDTAGRIEKFQARYKPQEAAPKKKKK